MTKLTKTESFAHQKTVIELSKDHRFFGLFMEQGTGKTHVTIATLTHLFRQGKINGVLILAPNGVQDNWAKNELPLHCNLQEDEYRAVVWRSTMSAKKRREFDAVCATAGAELPMAIVIANVEAARSDRFSTAIKNFISNRKFLIVIDESTTIKNPRALQSKHVHRLADWAAYSRILTGTPITQSPLDLWSQCRALGRNALPWPSYTAFKNQFAIEEVQFMGPRSFNKVVGYKNQAELAAAIAPFTHRVLKKDCLDLPEKIYQTRYIELSDEQRGIYRALTKQALAEVQPGIVTVTTALTLMTRLHQVTLGYVTNDDGNLVQIPHRRQAAITALFDEDPVKSIIFVRFIEDISQIRSVLDHLQVKYVIYSGAQGMALRGDAVDSFQNDPEVRAFIATSAAARGLTLTSAERVIYYSQGFSLETRLQSEDRAHRIGQKKNVVYVDLVAPGTIDEKVVSALLKKKQLADSVLDREELVRLLTLED